MASDSPARRGAVALLGPEQVVAVLREAHLAVRGHRPRDEAGHEVAGPVLERVGALLRRDPREELAPALRRGQEQSAQHDHEEARPRRSRTQPLGRAGRRDQLRRRGLARCDRGLERVAAGEHRGDDEGRGGPALRVLLEAREDRPLDRGVEVGDDRGGLDRPFVAVLARQLREPLALEGAPPRDELVDQEAERVDVAAGGDLAPLELLGRHVGGRPGAHVVARERLREAGQAEVGEADLALAVEHHVRGLQVAVEHALLVRRGEPRRHLPRDVQGLVLREPPDAAEERREVLPVHELHRQEVLTLGLADVPHAADGRVRDLPRHAHLAVEALEAPGVALERARQELEGHGMLELQVVGAVDLAHPAAAEEADDAVALAEDGAGREALPGTGAGPGRAGRAGSGGVSRGRRRVRPRDQRAGCGAGRVFRDVEACPAGRAEALGVGDGSRAAGAGAHDGNRFDTIRGLAAGVTAGAGAPTPRPAPVTGIRPRTARLAHKPTGISGIGGGPRIAGSLSDEEWV